MTVATVAEQKLEDLPIGSIRASSTNPRRSFDAAALTELSASIAEIGVQVPLLVRPLCDIDEPSIMFCYEVVAGERRLRAAKDAGLKFVPCLVREIEDCDVREIQIVENLQRADVPPIEEAEAFNELLGRLGSIPAVALKLGKEQSYIAKSLRLIALTLASRDALRAQLITIEHALLLARLAHAEQNAALKWTLDHLAGSKTTVEKVVEERIAYLEKNKADSYRYKWEAQSVVRLKSWIEAESGILLSRAPWSLTEEDYLLPDVGPCSECPKNTMANAPLFGDLEMGEATCTDGACFAAKTAGFVQIEMRKAGHDETAKPKVLVPRLSWKSSTVKPSIVPNDTLAGGSLPETANPAKLLKQGQWVEAKPGSCTNVRVGITADWSDANDRGYMGGSKKLRKPGEALHVCIAVGCKAHRKDWEKPKSSSNQQERHDPAAEKRAQEERAHVEKVEHEIRSKILHAILSKLDAAKAVRIVAEMQRNAAAWRKRLLDIMPELDGPGLEAFVVFCCEVHGHIQPNGYWMMQNGGVVSDRKQLWEIAQKAGVDASKVAAQYFHDAGSIAPASERLYPKGIPWPKSATAKKDVAKKSAKKAAKKAVTAKKSAAKKGGK